MNLWILFPEQLLFIPYMLRLPYLALVLYGLTLVVLFMQKEMRRGLAVFLLLSLMASTTMFFNLHPGFGKVLPPLALLAVMLYPMALIFINIKKQQGDLAKWWGFVWLAGMSHSLSWAVWLMALARS